jgi:hypothetical protein
MKDTNGEQNGSLQHGIWAIVTARNTVTLKKV